MLFPALPLVFFLVGLGLSQDEASLKNVYQATITLATRSAVASSPQVVATIQIEIDGLSRSGIISLDKALTISHSQRLDSFSLSTPTLMSDGPRQDNPSNLCDTTSLLNTTVTSPHYVNITLFNTTTISPRNTDITSLFNTTTIPPRFANSTSNFNATAGPSAPRPSATPTAPSIFTGSEVLTKPVFLDIYALFAAIVIQIAVI
jgi:hypothetical protein